MSSLAELRREKGFTQLALAKSMGTQLFRVQAAEFGLGHGGANSRTSEDFPDTTFSTSLGRDLRLSRALVNNAYRESCRLGDRQKFSQEEVPTQTFSDIIGERGLTLEEIAQITDIPISKMCRYAEGKLWCPRLSLGRLGTALHMHPLRVAVILWGDHHQTTQRWLYRYPHQLHEPVRPRDL